MPAFAVDLGGECGDCLASLRGGKRLDGWLLKCLHCEYRVKLAGGGRVLDVGVALGTREREDKAGHDAAAERSRGRDKEA